MLPQSVFSKKRSTKPQRRRRKLFQSHCPSSSSKTKMALQSKEAFVLGAFLYEKLEGCVHVIKIEKGPLILLPQFTYLKCYIYLKQDRAFFVLPKSNTSSLLSQVLFVISVILYFLSLLSMNFFKKSASSLLHHTPTHIMITD